MPKFRKSEAELASHLDYWLYYLNNLENLVKVPKKLKEDPVIQEAFDIAEYLAMSPDEQFAYQHDRKVLWDNKNAMTYLEEESIKKGLEKGLKQGLEQGLEQGIEKGLEKGLEKGKKEKAIEIAMNLLDVLDNETIAMKTGLSIDDLEKLRK
jgi:predicted transposase/invertase (TIGR01784 family)